MRRNILTTVKQLLFTGCTAGSAGKTAAYQQITPEKAKTMMDEQSGIVILDVRNKSEYDRGHIPNAVLLSLGSISESSAAAAIPTKDTVVLVYCHGGGRSKTAAKTLAELGYTQIYDLGGIINWPYETE